MAMNEVTWKGGFRVGEKGERVLKEAGDKQEQEKKWRKKWALRGSSDSLEWEKTMNKEKRAHEQR